MQPPPYHRIPRRHILVGGGAALLASVLGACAPPLPALRVGCIVFPGYEGLFLARDRGLLDAQRVRLVELLANTDTLRALAANQLEAAALTLDELMTARADGVDLRAVLVFDVSDGADVVLARAPVTLQTLAGKRVAVEDGAMGAVMFSAMLKAAALGPDQVHKVSMTLDRSEAMYLSGHVDVVVTAEPWATRLQKAGARRLFDSAAIPGRIVDVLAVRADALESHGPALRHLLQSYFAAQKMMHDAPERAAEWMSLRLQTPAPEVMDLFRGLNRPELEQNRHMLAPGGTVDQTAQALQRVMAEAGLLRPSSVLPSLTDPRFLPP